MFQNFKSLVYQISWDAYKSLNNIIFNYIFSYNIPLLILHIIFNLLFFDLHIGSIEYRYLKEQIYNQIDFQFLVIFPHGFL